jgi:phage/plasmid-associated DNA primase
MFFIVGGGSNGKSITMSFIQNALGLNLCASMKMALLTAKNANKANEADSAFMQAKGKTLLVFDEGSGNDILNSEKVKNMVNCNAQTARELFSIQENFFLHANSFCSTNHFPIIKSSDTDYGFWRRVLFYTAKSKFLERPDPKKPNEYKVDSEIEATLIKDPVYLNATLSIMAHYYEKLCTEYGRNINRVPCPTIIAETQKFREGQDKSFKYCLERIVLSPTSSILGSDLGVDYSNWAMTQYNDHIVASKAEEYLANNILAKYKSGNEYFGIRIRHGGIRKSKGEMAFSKYMEMTNEEQALYDEKARELMKENEEMLEKADDASEDVRDGAQRSGEVSDEDDMSGGDAKAPKKKSPEEAAVKKNRLLKRRMRDE